MRGGFIRLYWAVSLVWVLFWAWQRNLVCALDLSRYGGLDLSHYGGGALCKDNAADLVFHLNTAAILFGPPLALALVWWVIDGFRSN